MPDRLALLDSARHKLRLADYHAEALLAVLALDPPDAMDDPSRVQMEAHLEGLAHTGTAAAEKTIRAVAPGDAHEMAPIGSLVRAARESSRQDLRAFARRFESWWNGRDSGRRTMVLARHLRNDAAHRSYGKTPRGAAWCMSITGAAEPVPLAEFAESYTAQLRELASLVDDAEALVPRLAAATS